MEWVLPGGTPRRGESVASCARREVAEETGLEVVVNRVAFVVEASNQEDGMHMLDVVFTVTEGDSRAAPCEVESGLVPVFVPVANLHAMRLRPPVGGHLRNLHARGGRGEGAYLGNMWRPGQVPTPTGEA